MSTAELAALWMLDELWNIDKHRGVHLTTAAPLSASVSFEHPDNVQILRRWFMQGRPQTRPKDGQNCRPYNLQRRNTGR